MVLLQIDAFTDVPFAGNPAAVCLLDEGRPDAWMQSVAAEMNLAETAFVTARGNGAFALRWFTPTTEVPLCGHATLAAAHALWQIGRVPEDQLIAFETKSGTLWSRRAGSRVSIDLPARPVAPTDLPESLASAMGVTASWTGRTLEPEAFKFEYLIVTTETDLRRAQPDFAALRRMAGGVILTALSESPDVDIVSRYFAPYYGVDEDPVTGSAHCALAPYWTPLLGRKAFRARQASSRGGVLEVTLDENRVHLTGGAVTIFRGELNT